MSHEKLIGIERVLFDFDGTLFDTQKLHAEVEAQIILKEHGMRVNPNELSVQFAGWPTEKVFQAIIGCDDMEAKRLFGMKWDMLFHRAKEAEPLAPLASVFEFLLNKGISLAIGTASVVAWPKVVLAHHNLSTYFIQESIIGGDMVLNGKPHPDIWLKAAKDISTQACLVVEDGLAGIDAANSAKMRSCLLLPKTHPSAMSVSSVNDLVLLL